MAAQWSSEPSSTEDQPGEKTLSGDELEERADERLRYFVNHGRCRPRLAISRESASHFEVFGDHLKPVADRSLRSEMQVTTRTCVLTVADCASRPSIV